MSFRNRIFDFSALAGLLAALLFPAGVSAQELPPLEAFAMRPIILDVDLSPSGEHLAVVRLPGQGENYVIQVFETADMSAAPYTLGSDTMDIIGINWANDERLLVRTRQPVEVPGRRVGYASAGVGLPGRVKTYAYKLLSVGLDGGRWVELPSKSNIARFASETVVQRLASPILVHRLPDEDEWVLIEWFGSDDVGTEVFRVNIEDGRSESLVQLSSSYGDYRFDYDGDLRIRSVVARNENRIYMEYRLKDDTAWNEWLSYDVDDRRPLSVLGFVPGEPNRVYVLTAQNRDTEGIFLYDMTAPDAEPELLFAIDRYDAGNVVTACISQACIDGDEDPRLVGFYYTGDAPEIYYIDEEAELLQRSIDAALPPDNFNSIHDRAADDRFIVIQSTGPREPGRYYLLTDKRQLQLIGRTTAVEPEQIGDSRVVWYEARDGMLLNAVLTLPPHGEPPYPTIANPHGGPQSRDSLHWSSSYWDEWPHLLASRGYAVLQPNFRGSTGFGYDYFAAGDRQWGYRMQDDVDDGMQFLVEQGIADPERMAIFGWSYGGYSAMVGAMREPNIYQCSIAGAGVSSMELISKEAWNYRFREVIQRSQGGLSPIVNMDDVNIPILLVHGDRDLIVPIRHSDLFALELERRDKPFRYEKLIDAAHTVDTLGFDHNMQFYTAMFDFLENDCGF